MSNGEIRLRQTLAKIAELANAAANDESHEHNHDRGETLDGKREAKGKLHGQELHCSPKRLPARLLVEAAENARRINPVNGLNIGPMADFGPGFNLDPMRIAVLTAKYWGPQPRRLTVSFMERSANDLRRRIVSHLNAWSRTAGISFVETSGVGVVRISRRGGGYWSYLGTDILLIPHNRPTMNLEGFTMNTPDREFLRVVRHEAGHTLGFPHEHMRAALVARIDRNRAYEHFYRTQGWSRDDVDQQVLTSLEERSLMGTSPDQDSIMCYQLPGSITRDGIPIPGGLDINASDYAFAGRIYPKSASAEGSKDGHDTDALTDGYEAEDEWDPSEDVELTDELIP